MAKDRTRRNPTSFDRDRSTIIVLRYDLIIITIWTRLTLKFHELEEVLILGPFLFLGFDEFLQIDSFKLHLLR